MTMLDWIKKHTTAADDATDVIVASPDWEVAAATVTVIDIEEFEAAHDDPAWREFCERAEKYRDSVQREVLA